MSLAAFVRAGVGAPVRVVPGKVDEDLAEEQAAALHEAGVQKLLGTDDDVFVDIIGKESRAQIQVHDAGGWCFTSSHLVSRRFDQRMDLRGFGRMA